MTAITAQQVQVLRSRTGQGLMACKKALTDANGDLERAIEIMKEQGQLKAEKKASRTTAEGSIGAQRSDDGKTFALVEMNSETDFVAKEQRFQEFLKEVTNLVVANSISSLDALNQATLASGKTVEAHRLELVSTLGENITIRRVKLFDLPAGCSVGSYLHGSPARIGSVVILEGGSDELAQDVAMHLAAMGPKYIDMSGIPSEEVEKEKAIFMEKTAQESQGKPQEIVEKIVEGRVKKHFEEQTLMGQAFVKDPKQTVAGLLKSANAKLVEALRFEVGEGIEKKTADFAEEVKAQVDGAKTK